MKQTIETPICDFVSAYVERQTLRLHMPGHKGKGLLGEQRDITEIDGADVLYHGDGIIRQSEKIAASLFGSVKTLYSTEGSSLAIRAMLTLTAQYAQVQGKTPRILAGRNAHKVFMSASALLDLDVEWIYPQGGGSLICCDVTAEMLDKRLAQMPELPTAVYLTSPDYLGNTVPLQEIAEVCHALGILLLVDNAHGAYLRFLSPSQHPMDLGADLCCDSAHKTLPSLTGGAYLHIAHRAPEFFARNAEQAMSLFASTSPSYLILQSLDALNATLSQGYSERLSAFCDRMAQLKARLTEHGYSLIGDEPLKLTVATKSFGYTGVEVAKHLASSDVVCEFYDADFVTMMFTPELTDEELIHVEQALFSISPRTEILEQAPTVLEQQRAMSMHDALFASSCLLPIESCEGKILAEARVACPPAIPIVVCGERMDRSAIRCMQYYGITECRVVKESLQ